jgi:lipid-binding SYLF domain-containing protein
LAELPLSSGVGGKTRSFHQEMVDMDQITRRGLVGGLGVLGAMGAAGSAIASSRDPQADVAALAALQQLVASNPAAQQLNRQAVAALGFPRIIKVGFLFGGAHGEGALLKGNQTLGYYNSASASNGMPMRCFS